MVGLAGVRPPIVAGSLGVDAIRLSVLFVNTGVRWMCDLISWRAWMTSSLVRGGQVERLAMTMTAAEMKVVLCNRMVMSTDFGSSVGLSLTSE